VQTIPRPEALPRLADADPVEPGPVQPKPGSHRPVEFSAAAERARQAALAEYNAAERARRGLPPEVGAPSPPTSPEPLPGTPADVAQGAAQEPAAEPIAPSAPVAPPAPGATERAPAQKVAAAPAPKPTQPKAAARPAPAKEPRTPAVEITPAAPSIDVAVERTQWHPLAGRRIAWLRVPGESEPHRVVEGDVVDGLLVSAIEPSGVVFERDGEKIRRALGK
jgi:hypothetical protein